MRAFLAGLLALGALAVGVAPSGVGASNGFRPSGVVLHSGAPARVAVHPGPTQSFNCGSISCTAYQTGVNSYLQDVAADSGTSNNVYSTTTQYSDNTGSIAYNETFGGTTVDTNPFPANGCTSLAASICVSESQLVTEIGNVLAANGWTASATNLFFILLPAGVDTCFLGSSATYCASDTFCAYHASSGPLIFAVEPFSAAFSCSSVGQGFPNGTEIDETINTISHEQNEAITDPDTSNPAWYSSSGDENGDLCAWSFGSDAGITAGGQPYNQVINGHNYSLQMEYSNADNGCVQHLGGTATGISNGGTGPLTYHGGPVMRTNTVYTIYWFPTAPAISSPPAVSGTTAVGKTLTTTTGTWTSSPTAYSYQWQRCDNAGANCIDIPGATSTTYTLVADDAGHTIRSEVLASNSVGASAYAPSVPTALVVAKPAVITNPKISGKAKVGKTLSVKTGSWTYSPTSYAYKWLRCSKSGGACKAIKGGTKSSYTLKKSDAGHKFAAQVTAKNAAGSMTAISAKSGVVKK